MPLDSQAARLTARPSAGHRPAQQPGLRMLGAGGERDGLLSVPAGYDPAVPVPLLVLLHGAGGDCNRILGRFEPAIEAFRMLLVIPDSRGATWDVILGGFGPDVAYLDAALRNVFATFAVDPNRLAIGGFSDGASYALTLGLANGDLFSHVLAFSPGFLAPVKPHGEPRIFLSHGTADRVLPIKMCGGVLAPMLEQANYDVAYREFDGGHTIPDHVADAAFRWFVSEG